MLFELPDDLLAKITSGSHGFPLLALSRRGRNLVLERARAIQLKLHWPLSHSQEQPTVAAAARLLDRACRAAAPGLQVEIKRGGNFCFEPPLLSLLQHGLDAGGWGSAHALSLEVRERSCQTGIRHAPVSSCNMYRGSTLHHRLMIGCPASAMPSLLCAA
jgi:hypothetical protein